MFTAAAVSSSAALEVRSSLTAFFHQPLRNARAGRVLIHMCSSIVSNVPQCYLFVGAQSLVVPLVDFLSAPPSTTTKTKTSTDPVATTVAVAVVAAASTRLFFGVFALVFLLLLFVVVVQRQSPSSKPARHMDDTTTADPLATITANSAVQHRQFFVTPTATATTGTGTGTGTDIDHCQVLSPLIYPKPELIQRVCRIIHPSIHPSALVLMSVHVETSAALQAVLFTLTFFTHLCRRRTR
ncbi:unnamed protein product [Soboliphyme baturini]|uniref:Membrane-associated protein n=1 Tax=Soboliphyme baturini TaxID=241478 RepID=A0A183IGV9_9BILA|nr:unnamed protein product [Soboliphyme baturini]